MVDPLGGINTLWPLFGIANDVVGTGPCFVLWCCSNGQPCYVWCWLTAGWPDWLRCRLAESV
ncbi:hypothetical protein ACLK1Z_03660 [Escherichia coli]